MTNLLPPRCLCAFLVGIIASKRCNNVKIHHNTVYDGGEGAVGIFLHRSSDDCEVWGKPTGEVAALACLANTCVQAK